MINNYFMENVTELFCATCMADTILTQNSTDLLQDKNLISK